MSVLGILSACNKLFAILFSSVYNAQGSRKNTAYFGCGSRQEKTFGLANTEDYINISCGA